MADILAGEDFYPDDVHHSAAWPAVSAAGLALLQIADCEDQLERAPMQPLRLVQAAKSAHSALQAALTAALAGSMGIGAYNEELEGKWRNFLQQARGEHPNKWHVLNFQGLIEKAQSQPLEWSSLPLVLEPEDKSALEKLTAIRDGVEHPKPGFWIIEPEWLYRIIPVGPRLALKLLQGVSHQLEPGELDAATAGVNRINALCCRLTGSVCQKRSP